MNFIEGTLTQSGFRTADGTLLPVGGPSLPAVETPAHYGIRPEHLALSDSGIPVTVELVEPTGAETHVTARLGGHEITIVSKSRLDARPGDVLPISLVSERSHLFEASTGRRI